MSAEPDRRTLVVRWLPVLMVAAVVAWSVPVMWAAGPPDSPSAEKKPAKPRARAWLEKQPHAPTRERGAKATRRVDGNRAPCCDRESRSARSGAKARPPGLSRHRPEGPPPRLGAHPEPAPLEARVAALERQVRELRREVERLRQVSPPSAGPRAAGRPVPPPGGGERVQVRVYRLAEGKLDALWELLARDDVPVPVERVAGGIAVHAPPPQQRIIAAFVRLIAPEVGPEADRPRGPRERSQPRRQRRAGPERPDDGRRVLSRDEAPAPQELLEVLHAQLERRLDQVQELREKAEQAMHEVEQLEGQIVDLHAARRELHRSLEQAEINGHAQRVEQLEQRLRGLERELEDLNWKRDRFERRARRLSEAADALEEHLTAMRETVEQLHRTMRDLERIARRGD